MLRRAWRLSGGTWAGVLVVGVVLFEGVRVAFATTNNVHYAPALILIGAATVPSAAVVYSVEHGRGIAVSAAVLAGTALLGGVVGVIAAGLVEYETLQRLGVLPVVAIATIEETAKLLAPAALLLSPAPRRTTGDGLVVGLAAGAGFAVLETMGYAIAALVRHHDNLGAVDTTLLHRGLLSPASHMAWTGIVAAALWHTAARQSRARDTPLCIGAFVTAVVLHTCWDAIGTLTAYIVLAAVGVSLLLAIAAVLPRYDSSMGGPIT